MTLEEALYACENFDWYTTVHDGIVYTQTDYDNCHKTITYPVGTATPIYCGECIQKKNWSIGQWQFVEKGGRKLPKINKWCLDHNYNEGIEDMIRELKQQAGYDDKGIIETLQIMENVGQECGVSVQELIQHLMFLHERY